MTLLQGKVSQAGSPTENPYSDLMQDKDFQAFSHPMKMQYLQEAYLPSVDPTFKKLKSDQQIQYIQEVVMPHIEAPADISIQQQGPIENAWKAAGDAYNTFADGAAGTILGLGETGSYITSLAGLPRFRASDHHLYKSSPVARGAADFIGRPLGVFGIGTAAAAGAGAAGLPGLAAGMVGFGAVSANENIQRALAGEQNIGQTVFNTALDTGLAGLGSNAKNVLRAALAEGGLGAAGSALGYAGNQLFTGKGVDAGELLRQAGIGGLMGAGIGAGSRLQPGSLREIANSKKAEKLRQSKALQAEMDANYQRQQMEAYQRKVIQAAQEMKARNAEAEQARQQRVIDFTQQAIAQAKDLKAKQIFEKNMRKRMERNPLPTYRTPKEEQRAFLNVAQQGIKFGKNIKERRQVAQQQKDMGALETAKKITGAAKEIQSQKQDAQTETVKRTIEAAKKMNPKKATPEQKHQLQERQKALLQGRIDKVKNQKLRERMQDQADKVYPSGQKKGKEQQNEPQVNPSKDITNDVKTVKKSKRAAHERELDEIATTLRSIADVAVNEHPVKELLGRFDIEVKISKQAERGKQLDMVKLPPPYGYVKFPEGTSLRGFFERMEVQKPGRNHARALARMLRLRGGIDELRDELKAVLDIGFAEGSGEAQSNRLIEHQERKALDEIEFRDDAINDLYTYIETKFNDTERRISEAKTEQEAVEIFDSLGEDATVVKHLPRDEWNKLGEKLYERISKIEQQRIAKADNSAVSQSGGRKQNQGTELRERPKSESGEGTISAGPKKAKGTGRGISPSFKKPEQQKLYQQIQKYTEARKGGDIEKVKKSSAYLNDMLNKMTKTEARKVLRHLPNEDAAAIRKEFGC